MAKKAPAVVDAPPVAMAISPKPMTDLITYPVSEAVIAALREKCAGLTCDTPEAYEETRVAIGNIRDTRVAIETRRVELKADAIAYGRMVDSEAKRYLALLVEIETPLKAKKDAVDEAKERAKAEKEAAKKAALEAEILAKREAEEAAAKVLREAEAAKLAAERAELDAERKRMAEEQARLDRERQIEAERVAEARRAEDARIDAERAALAAERRAEEERQRIEREAIDAERKRVQAEKDARDRAEFERQASIRAEQEAIKRIEHEHLENQRRAADLAALLPDLDKVTALAGAIRTIQAPILAPGPIAIIARTAMDRLARVAAAIDTDITAIKGAK
jgi:hypothetical protein